LQPQSLLLLKAIVEKIKNKYFSDNQNVNSNTILSKIEVELLDLLEINIPES
jgi:predicted DsbA family dithiol-disulfide isomerase